VNWRKLKVWQESHNLVLEIYRVTSAFPKSETYGLVNQLKRASYSIPVFSFPFFWFKISTRDFIRRIGKTIWICKQNAQRSHKVVKIKYL